MKTTDITRELGRLWKLLSDDEKKHFIDEAAKDKNRYTDEMKDYTPSPEWNASQSDSNDDNKTKKKRTGPKRSLSAYIFFCKDKRDGVKSENDDMTPREITAELGRMWREEYKQDDKKSKKYNKLATKDKERYNTEKENWVSEDESESNEEEKTKNNETDTGRRKDKE